MSAETQTVESSAPVKPRRITWHYIETGSERYLCGKPRGARIRVIPAAGGPDEPGRQCATCEIVYLNLVWTD